MRYPFIVTVHSSEDWRYGQPCSLADEKAESLGGKDTGGGTMLLPGYKFPSDTEFAFVTTKARDSFVAWLEGNWNEREIEIRLSEREED